jgi:tetratricopeptide (TPR) repeat protein
MDPFQRAANEKAAIALMDARNFAGAEVRLRTMLAHDPNDARALALMAQCRILLDDDKGGLKLAREAAAIDPDDPLVRSTLSHALIRNGKHKEADAVAKGLAEENPEDSHALFRAGIARHNMQDHKGARELFDEAERHLGDSAVDLLNMARLRLGQWNYARAGELATRALHLDPNQGDSFHILGECALAAKRPVEAYDLALEALRLEPGEKPILRLLTRARARQHGWLRPFLPGVDWIVEMDRIGLVTVPLVLLVLAASLQVSVSYDLESIALGEAPVIVVTVVLGGLLVYATVSYATALLARIRIWRDLRKISLPPTF